MRSFFRYLIREGALDANPAADVPAPRGPKRLPKTLDADQMNGIVLEICQRHLAPNGVAYISYNTYPGWHIRGIARDIMFIPWYTTREIAVMRANVNGFVPHPVEYNQGFTYVWVQR